MALKGIVDTLDDVPAPLHEHYVENGGKFYLQAEGLEVVGPLKSAFERQKADNVKLKKQIEDLTTRYDDLDPDAARKAIERLALIDSGKLEEVVTQRTEKMRADMEKRIAKEIENAKTIAAERDQFASKYTTTLMDNEFGNSAARAGLKPGAMPSFRAEAKQIFRVHDGKVIQFEGDEPVMGKDGVTPVTMDEWLGGKMADFPEAFIQDRGGGALNNGRGTTGTVRTIRRSDPDYAAKSARFFEDIADGKVEVVD